MTFLRLLPVILSALVLAAHFFRVRALLLVAVCLLFPFLLLWRKPWAARVVQSLLVLAGAEWIRTLFVLTERRRAEGEPWVRMVAILGAVAILTWASGLVFYSRALRERYGLTRGRPSGPVPPE